MDEGGTRSPAARCRELKPLRKQGHDSAESHAAPPTPLVSPNPRASDRGLTGNARSSGPSRRQHASDTNGAPAGKWVGVSRSHGYSSCRRVGGTGDDFLRRDGSSRGPQAKTSKGSGGVHAQGDVVGKSSLDAQQKGFRGTRSLPSSAGPDVVPFEVKMTDFPELAVGSLGKAGLSIQKESRGPPIRSSSPQMRTAASSRKSARNGPPTQTDPRQIDINGVPDSSAESPGPPGSTSWANVASQPPKKPVPKEKTICANEQTEETAAPREEGAPGKRKRKKKKRAKGAVEDAEDELEEPATYQELPKFEDEEEFPGLSPAVTKTERLKTSSYAAKVCNEENQREAVQQHQSADPKEKAPAEPAKKAQKVSGKKSKAPVQLDIGNMLAALEMKQSQKAKPDAKPVILLVGGGLTAVQKQKKLPWQQDKIAHNPLDSTSPLVKKGKQREVPKAKKPTPLKKVILKEREERKQKRLQEERGLPLECEFTPAHDDDVDAAEEKVEVEEEEEEESVERKATASDEVGSPKEELEGQLDINSRDQMVKAHEDEIVEQRSVSPVPCPPSRPKIHSRKFRDYCSQMLSKDVDECVTALLKELVRFQDRLYQKDPMKARMKRRIVMGLREVLKHLKLRKVKCVILSPNCERIQAKGGLDEALYTIIDTCREQGVPFVFALSRKALGRCVNKAVPVSLVGIFNYDGAQDFYHKMIELSSEARRAYEVMVSSLEQTGQPDPEEEAAAAAESVEEKLQISGPAEEAELGHDTTQPEEPEYMKTWKRMLEKGCNHKFLNFEEQLSAMHLDTVCAENTDEDEKS
ncbi:selenocysteine insertion sequence-binding protein 2-like [Spinachia spinachia]